MNLDITLHRTMLFQLLQDIYVDPVIAPFLGFKGGTALMFLYGLDRFSVDLDFDLLDESKEQVVFLRMTEILTKHGKIKDAHAKRYNLFFLLSYADDAYPIKIEINRRHFTSRYEVKTYLGVSMLVMVIEDMFAHKLVALSERLGKTSRDLYDVWFFLSKRTPLNVKILEERSQLTPAAFIQQCIQQIEDLRPRAVLNGVGELLTEQRKDWAREKLKEETIGLLKLRDTILS